MRFSVSGLLVPLSTRACQPLGCCFHPAGDQSSVFQVRRSPSVFVPPSPASGVSRFPPSVSHTRLGVGSCGSSLQRTLPTSRHLSGTLFFFVCGPFLAPKSTFLFLVIGGICLSTRLSCPRQPHLQSSRRPGPASLFRLTRHPCQPDPSICFVFFLLQCSVGSLPFEKYGARLLFF